MKKHYFNLIFFLFVNYLFAQEQTFEWAKAIYNAQNTPQEIVVDAQGDIYIVGGFWNVPDFDPGEGVFSFPSTNSKQHGYVLKLDAESNFIWAKQIVCNDSATIQGIVFDNDGNFYIRGIFEGTMDLDMGEGVDYFTYIPPIGLTGFNRFVAKYDADGNYLWGKVYDEIVIKSFSTDYEGNIYLGGYFVNTPDFDPGEGVYNLTSAGNGDIFISKLDTNGNFLWVKQIGGTESDHIESLVLDNDANIYVNGYFTGENIDFNPGEDVFILDPNQPYNGNYRDDTFVLKLTNNGDFVWAKKLGGQRENRPSAIALDIQGNVITTGYFYGIADFDPDTEQEYLLESSVTSWGAHTISNFFSALDADGNFLWAKKIDALGGMTVRKVIPHPDGELYFGGIYRGTITDGEHTITSEYANLDESFISKLDLSGEMVWIKALKGSSGYANSLLGLYLDDEKSIYAAGVFRGIIDMNPDEEVFNLESNHQVTYILKMSIENEMSLIGNTENISFEIYPNPVRDEIRFLMPTEIGSGVQYEVFNTLGQQISKGALSSDSLQLNYLESGMYFIRLTYDGKSGVRKFVKN